MVYGTFCPILAMAEQAGPIVSMDDLEHHKENIQPKRSGRSANTLLEVCTAEKSQAALEQERLILERRMLTVREDHPDPLDFHHRYVQFLDEHYPSGYKELLLALENSARTFKLDERYKNDIRYFNIWIRIARQTRDPLQVFKYMSVNEIGTQLAPYYDEYGDYLISRKRYDEALEILRLGINRNALPVERLRRKLEALDAKMSAIREGGQEEEQIESAEPAPSRRPALGHVAAGDANFLEQSQKGQGKIQVFCDRDAKETSKDIVDRVMPSSTSANPWSEIGTSISQKKENVREPSRWSAANIPQRKTARGQPPPVRSKIEVYQDEPSDTDIQVPSAIHVLQEKDIKVATQSSTTAMLSEIEGSAPVQPKPNTEPNRTKASGDAAAASTKFRESKLMAKLEKEDADGMLLSPEEHRALTYTYAEESSNHLEEDVEEDISMEMDLSVYHTSMEAPNTLPTKDIPGSNPHNVKSYPSPTINTKAANAEVLKMFSQPLQMRDSPPPPEPAARGTTGAFYVEDDETISSKVFKRQTTTSIGVFEDHDDDEEGIHPQNENHSFGSNESSQNFKDESVLAEKQGKSASSVRQPADNPAKDSKKALFSGLLHSTPYRQGVHLEHDENSSFTNSQVPFGRSGRALEPMTPITEVSHEVDRTALLSTIGRSYGELSNGADDGHTLMTLATFGERTFSNISYCGNGGDEMDERSDSSKTFDERPPIVPTASSSAAAHLSEGHVGNLGDDMDRVHIASDENASLSRAADKSISEDLSRSRTISSSDTQSSGRSTSPINPTAISKPISEQLQQPKLNTERTSPKIDNVLSAHIPNPCNPMTDLIVDYMTRRSNPESLKNLYFKSRQMSNFGDLCEKAMKTIEKASGKSKSHAILPFTPSISLQGSSPMNVKWRLGEGGFGRVYLMEADDDSFNTTKFASFNDFDDDDSLSSDSELFALKVHFEPTSWEFCALANVRDRVGAQLARSIANPRSCHIFKNESCLLMDYESHGSLLDAVNSSAKYGYASGTGGAAGGGVDEALAAFWAIELLRILEGVHAAGFIHRDIKPDNILLRLDTPQEEWSDQYHADGSAGWHSKGLLIVDWGTSIDKSKFESDQRFIVEFEEAAKAKKKRNKNIKVDSSTECWEFRNSKSWTFEPDWYGAACVLHVLLFGKYMEVEEEAAAGGGRPRQILKTALKRYWQVNIWKPLFDLLLNAGSRNSDILATNGPNNGDSPPVPEFPVSQAIKEKRLELEAWLVTEASRTKKNLRGLLKRVATGAEERKFKM
ncbi:hypothetical protein DFS34DRAFT_607527 [Phlyctochytrium arcticum]|nr:hypothetical protein DFS34DRAFT_607527 [Phlyctochytrium arcticum]